MSECAIRQSTIEENKTWNPLIFLHKASALRLIAMQIKVLVSAHVINTFCSERKRYCQNISTKSLTQTPACLRGH